MDPDNDIQGQSDSNEAPQKLSLKLPDAGDDSSGLNSPPPTLSLKKPSGLTEDAGAPPPPATLTLKKPDLSNSSSPTPPGTLTLKKPELTTPKSGGTPGTLSLKKPLEISVEKELNPPADSSIKMPGESSDPPTTLTLNVPAKAGSKLAEPGNLDLKKPSQIIDTSDIDDDSGGLRLRKAVPSTPPKSVNLDETSVNLAIIDTQNNSREKSSHSPTGLQMRKPGESSPESKLANQEGEKKAGSGLSLRKTESVATSMPDLTPPGLEPSAPPAPNQSDEKEKSIEKNDLTSGEGKINAPPQEVEEITFAPKKKKSLSTKAKLQLLPLILIGVGIIALFGIFLKNLFATKAKKQEQFHDQEAELQKKKAALKLKKAAKKKAKEERRQAALDALNVKFPQHLLDQLVSEYGEDAKDQFMGEWNNLSNEERKKYLREIGAEANNPEKDIIDPKSQ